MEEFRSLPIIVLIYRQLRRRDIIQNYFVGRNCTSKAILKRHMLFGYRHMTISPLCDQRIKFNSCGTSSTPIQISQHKAILTISATVWRDSGQPRHEPRLTELPGILRLFSIRIFNLAQDQIKRISRVPK